MRVYSLLPFISSEPVDTKMDWEITEIPERPLSAEAQKWTQILAPPVIWDAVNGIVIKDGISYPMIEIQDDES